MIQYEIYCSEINKILGTKMIIDKKYEGVSTLEENRGNTVIFVKKITNEKKEIISKMSNCLVITEDVNNYSFLTLAVKNTRLAMCKVLNYIKNKKEFQRDNFISKLSVINENVILGKEVIIEDFVYIGPNVVIGDNTIVKQGAKILENVEIGKNCVIRENSVIGGQGFGVEKDENENNLKISHLGGVKVKNNVEIGALNTIVSGTIKPTIIEDYVKIDDHVHIAHNCHIKNNCIITAGVILSGSVTIEPNVWIGPNSTIKNSLNICEENLIGIGSVITKDIKNTNGVYAGVPGQSLEMFLMERKAIKYISKNLDIIKKNNDI